MSSLAVDQDEREKWLAANAVECKRYGMRLSPTSCEQHQATSPDRCKGCGRFVSDLEVKRQLYVVRKKGAQVASHRVAECKECKRVMPLPGRGLCGKCYGLALKAEGKPAQQKTAVAEPASPIDDGRGTIMYEAVNPLPAGIDWLFAGEEEMRKKIEAAAKAQRRDVRQQVLFYLDQTI